MLRQRTWTDEQFIEAVRNCRSVRSVLQAIGLNPTGANYKTAADTVARLNLDTSHWKGQGYLKGLSHLTTSPGRFLLRKSWSRTARSTT